MEEKESFCIVFYLGRGWFPWKRSNRNRPYRVIHWHFPRADIVNCENAKPGNQGWLKKDGL